MFFRCRTECINGDALPARMLPKVFRGSSEALPRLFLRLPLSPGVETAHPFRAPERHESRLMIHTKRLVLTIRACVLFQADRSDLHFFK